MTIRAEQISFPNGVDLEGEQIKNATSIELDSSQESPAYSAALTVDASGNVKLSVTDNSGPTSVEETIFDKDIKITYDRLDPSSVIIASSSTAGSVQLATSTEAQGGTEDEKVITPLTLASVTATETRAGLIELATQTEVNAGTDTARALTPATLFGLTTTETRAGLIELATQIEVDAGTDMVRAVTPATLAAYKLPAVQKVVYSGYADSLPGGGEFSQQIVHWFTDGVGIGSNMLELEPGVLYEWEAILSGTVNLDIDIDLIGPSSTLNLSTYIDAYPTSVPVHSGVTLKGKVYCRSATEIMSSVEWIPAGNKLDGDPNVPFVHVVKGNIGSLASPIELDIRSQGYLGNADCECLILKRTVLV